jgi:hypothetical protein
MNLRVAVADSVRAIWTGIGPASVPHMTALDSLPTMITSDSTGGRTLQAGGAALYMALGRAIGTTENSLKEGTSGVERIDEIPAAYGVKQNYPNPFNPSTTIRYGLPEKSQVTLTVFNTLGQQVSLLQNGEMDAGYHEVKFDAAGLSSGVYFYRLQAGTFVETKRLLLLR